MYAHNKVRAFAGWPGTTAEFVINSMEPDEEKIKVKIVTTRVRRKVGGAVLGVHQISCDDTVYCCVVCCSVLHCGHCDVVCCSVLHCAAVCYIVCISCDDTICGCMVCCSVLQCAAV